jgi:hypothetical protein
MPILTQEEKAKDCAIVEIKRNDNTTICELYVYGKYSKEQKPFAVLTHTDRIDLAIQLLKGLEGYYPKEMKV